jgi:opacity protein-like surface antigen
MAGILFSKIFKIKKYFMKKICIFLLSTALSLSVFECSTFAQTTSPYVYIKPIYAFPANPQLLNQNSVQIQGQEFTKGIYGSYGRGFCLQAGVGKMINTTFGFELGAEYDFGKKISVTDIADSTLAGSFSDKVQGVLLKPMLVIRNSGDLLSIYSKLGFAISVYSRRFETGAVELSISGTDELTTYKSTEIINAKLGFTACFGLAFRVSESISLFTEINGQMISLPVTKGQYTQYLVNGKDQLATLDVFEKSWVYEKSGFFSAPVNFNQPEPRLFQPANYSYIGIGIGFIYHF